MRGKRPQCFQAPLFELALTVGADQLFPDDPRGPLPETPNAVLET